MLFFSSKKKNKKKIAVRSGITEKQAKDLVRLAKKLGSKKNSR